jgi:mRNA-degrading endonuclease toxin of MazEF toxin-antitoxin module
MGVRIREEGDKRTVTFVSNPRFNDHTAAVIKSCI